MQQNLRRATAGDRALAGELNSALIHALRAASRGDQDSPVGRSGLSALSVLVFAGDQRLGDLAAIEQVSKATMSRVVDVLERDGYAARAADPVDGRAVLVRSTAAGRRVLLEARERRIGFLVERLRSLSAAEVEVVRTAVPLLERLGASSA